MSANLDYGSGVGLTSPLLEPDEAPAPNARRREVFLCTYLVTLLTVVGGVCVRFGVEHFAMKTCHDFESSLSSTSPTEYPRWGELGCVHGWVSRQRHHLSCPFPSLAHTRSVHLAQRRRLPREESFRGNGQDHDSFHPRNTPPPPFSSPSRAPRPANNTLITAVRFHSFYISFSSLRSSRAPSFLPRQIIQYGKEQSVATLQYQTLCALTAVAADPKAKVQCVHLEKMYADQDFNYNCRINGGDDAGCSEVGGSNPGGDDYYVVAKTRQLLVSPEAQSRGETATSLSRAAFLPGEGPAGEDDAIDSGSRAGEDAAARRRINKVSTWLFFSAETEQDWRSDPDAGSMIGRVAGAGYVDRASCSTLDDILSAGPGGLVEKYRRGFAAAGATPEDTGAVREYVELWHALRLCCGKEMSRSHKLTMQGRGDELTEEERAEGRAACGDLDVGEAERKLVETEVFRRFRKKIPALAAVSSEAGICGFVLRPRPSLLPPPAFRSSARSSARSLVCFDRLEV